MAPHFSIPLNLPHAGKIAVRIHDIIDVRGNHDGSEYEDALALAKRMMILLDPYLRSGENPGPEECERVADEAAFLGRAMVEAIVDADIAGDRIGQCIRNYFECLELGEEGAEISLRAGENPRSLQRPY